MASFPYIAKERRITAKLSTPYNVKVASQASITLEKHVPQTTIYWMGYTNLPFKMASDVTLDRQDIPAK
jgi:hypothetical protein